MQLGCQVCILQAIIAKLDVLLVNHTNALKADLIESTLESRINLGLLPSITDRVQCKKNLALKKKFFQLFQTFSQKKKKL